MGSWNLTAEERESLLPPRHVTPTSSPIDVRHRATGATHRAMFWDDASTLAVEAWVWAGTWAGGEVARCDMWVVEVEPGVFGAYTVAGFAEHYERRDGGEP